MKRTTSTTAAIRRARARGVDTMAIQPRRMLTAQRRQETSAESIVKKATKVVSGTRIR